MDLTAIADSAIRETEPQIRRLFHQRTTTNPATYILIFAGERVIHEAAVGSVEKDALPARRARMGQGANVTQQNITVAVQSEDVTSFDRLIGQMILRAILSLAPALGETDITTV